MASNPFNTAENTNSGAKSEKMNVHRQLFENKMRENEGNPTNAYVSPSDAIMSPASQKLSGFKQRQMNKSNPVKPRTLFAKSAASKPEEETAETKTESA
ncbi:hypothetical protein E4T42_02045 [Aureobasidium subglaciale]|uniref:Spo12-like protein n=1 Tax=Aureobasidium subglaciale (strain EXF-2481) TaxID=1043005 RepID=A0A074YAE1_AURSE|nr:uncharacterized protein AUEXF2481DRAFT_40709 [Aureobasidium subglaciale EXF-2481]KAI5212452.1 hypothetical protein E4T38_00489 [Aureobasidium subglaciale]KAI5231695.1 hypothetical protein E4T40_00415 [Aureobasidium subglaciale]KAI5234503.1 hypothetical protein E4T41_00488 [Aureobasidium subglaciale]KAI5254909.1 hypothetical protein E4T42_02045 [Aureobasidium subglaciale]KAI5267830.1 hypothetical protein E4T46_00488 [Aureobasidium subglaciale]